MSDQNKVVKFKKRKNINIGIIVFLILFLYIVINVYIYFTKEHLSIYEVHEGTTAIDNHITGIILRDETIVSSEEAGYISYYQKEGARVAKNSAVYSVDVTGQIYSLVADSEVAITLSDKNNAEIRHDIRSFQSGFSDSKFSGVYTFKESAQSTVLDILNSTVISQGEALAEETGITYSYHMIPSTESGIISYYIDSFEAVTPETVTESMFQAENYQRTSLRTAEMVTQNTPIYKLISSEIWNIVLPLTQVQYEKLQEVGKDTISFTFLEDNFETKAALTLIMRDSSYYAQLTLNKYLSNYLEDRFVDIELDFNSIEGLKIPVTSLVEKEFYTVPIEYLCLGGDSQEQGLIIKTYKKNGDIDTLFTAIDIYYEDGAYAYIDADLFEPGTVIHLASDSKDYSLSQTGKLIGVYNVNLGYAVFKRVEILSQNEEYCIINKNTTYGLSAYDQIALDGSTAENQAIIY